MKNSAKFGSKGRLLFVGVMLAFVGNLALMLKVMEATSFTATPPLPTETPYPTHYPPEKQTGEAAGRQTQRAAALTPPPAGTASRSWADSA